MPFWARSDPDAAASVMPSSYFVVVVVLEVVVDAADLCLLGDPKRAHQSGAEGIVFCS